MMFIRITGESFFTAALRRTLAPLAAVGLLLAGALATAGEAATAITDSARTTPSRCSAMPSPCSNLWEASSISERYRMER